MALVPVGLTASFNDVGFRAVTSARPTIRLSVPVSNGAEPLLVPTSVSCWINSAGQLVPRGWQVGSPAVVPLVALDVDSHGDFVQPQQTHYVIDGVPGAAPRTFIITAEMAPTIDLTELPPVTPGMPVSIVVGPPGPQGAPAANLDGGTPASTYTPTQLIDGGTP